MKIEKVLSSQLHPLRGGQHTIRGIVHYVDGTTAVIRNVTGAALEAERIVITARKSKTLGSESNRMTSIEHYKLSRFDVRAIVWVQSLDAVAVNTLVWHLHNSTLVKVDINTSNTKNKPEVLEGFGI